MKGQPAHLTALDAAARVLAEAGQALRASEITDRILESGAWVTRGKTPGATVHAQIAMDIKTKGDRSRFVRTAPATFGLRDRPADDPAGSEDHGGEPDDTATMSFTDAAERILRESGQQEPMHYGVITTQALARGLIQTAGLTPERTMYAQLASEIDRRRKRADSQRFTRFPRGMFGLASWEGGDPQGHVAAHNRQTKTDLRARLLAMDPAGFEVLIGDLLTSLGYQEVEVTRRHGDGGVDVRATLVVGDVIRTRMAVQAKRWKHNVQAPTVQQVRGALGAHDQGLIITTSGFSVGAQAEAARANAAPVGLMDGATLVDLLVEHQIGVRREAVDLIWLMDPRGVINARE